MVLFLEVTERFLADRALRESEARKAALVELGDRLRETADTERMAYAAAEIMGTTLCAVRAGYGTVDTARQTVESRRRLACARGRHRRGAAQLRRLWHLHR